MDAATGKVTGAYARHQAADVPAPSPAPPAAPSPASPAPSPPTPLAAFAEFAMPGASLLFYELVLKASTTGGFWPQLPIITLFSASLGALAYLLTSLSRRPAVNRAVKLALIATLSVLFSVAYFVFREFKMFYDPITVLAGASDVAGQFGGTAASLVLSFSGIAHVALFLAPAAAYAVLARLGIDQARTATAGTRFNAAAIAVGTYLTVIVILNCIGPLWQAYTSRYTFDTAVSTFGLATALRKDAQAALAGGGVSFTETGDAAGTATGDDTAAATTGDATTTDDDPSAGVSALDIDFAALATNATDVHAQLDTYVAGLTPSAKNAQTGAFSGYNLIFVTAEALSAEAIRADTTPTLYRMATRGINFTDYYQFDTAGTTGGECANLFGLLATEGGNSVKLTATYDNHLTMGAALGRLGYNGWAFHNNTYTYYDRHLTHNNLGYSNGYMGYGNGMETWVSWQWPQSDLEMVQGSFDNLYADAEPFNVYYMSVSGHSDYSAWDNAMSAKHWDTVANLTYSDPVKAYLAANVELDRAMAYLVDQLEKRGLAERTVIVVAADHFPYGLDDDAPVGQLPYTSELYGYNVDNLFQRDHNRLIIWSATLENDDPIVVDTPTSSIDILPTLSNLFGVAWDSRLLPGRDVFSDAEPLVFNLNYDWRSELGTYFAGTGAFYPAEGAEVPDGYVDATNATVANKINYCHGVLTSDYYRHVFSGTP